MCPFTSATLIYSKANINLKVRTPLPELKKFCANHPFHSKCKNGKTPKRRLSLLVYEVKQKLLENIKMKKKNKLSFLVLHILYCIDKAEVTPVCVTLVL